MNKTAPRKRTQQVPAWTAKKWAKIFDASPNLVSIHDRDFRIIWTNKAFAAAFKMKPQKLVGQKCYAIIHSSPNQPKSCPHSQVLRTGSPAHAEIFDPHFGCYLDVSVSPIFNQRGELSGSIHITKDITARKKMTEKLIRGEQFINDLIDTLDDVFYVFDAQGHFIRWNKALEQVSGYSHVKISRMEPADFFTKKGAANIAIAIREAFRKGHAAVEEELLTKDGRRIPMFFSGSIMKDFSDQPILCGTGKDITELKQKTRQALRRR